jgi:hypothetical protein
MGIENGTEDLPVGGKITAHEVQSKDTPPSDAILP